MAKAQLYKLIVHKDYNEKIQLKWVACKALCYIFCIFRHKYQEHSPLYQGCHQAPCCTFKSAHSRVWGISWLIGGLVYPLGVLPYHSTGILWLLAVYKWKWVGPISTYAETIIGHSIVGHYAGFWSCKSQVSRSAEACDVMKAWKLWPKVFCKILWIKPRELHGWGWWHIIFQSIRVWVGMVIWQFLTIMNNGVILRLYCDFFMFCFLAFSGYGFLWASNQQYDNFPVFSPRWETQNH
jgi:hypothetical protein